MQPNPPKSGRVRYLTRIALVAGLVLLSAFGPGGRLTQPLPALADAINLPGPGQAFRANPVPTLTTALTQAATRPATPSWSGPGPEHGAIGSGSSGLKLGQTHSLPAGLYQAWQVQQQAELIATDGAASDTFGNSVAVSSDGNTALIGADGKQLGSNSEQGAVYVYIRSGGSWSLQARLAATDGATNDFFGSSVALSSDGNTALIGADGVAEAAYIFTRTTGRWTERAKLSSAGGNFGSSVTLSGDGSIALVGAFEKTVGSNNFQGAAYIYTGSGSSWSLQAQLTAADGRATDFFGYSVALSSNGSTAFIGSPNNQIGSNYQQGAVYVYTNNGGSWNQQTKLTAADGTASDLFGDSVAVSNDGNTALIGADGKQVGVNKRQGVAYIYTDSGGSWNQQAELTAADGAASDFFGNPAALSGDGNTAFIGTALKTIGSNNYEGAGYIFTRSDSSWSQQAELIAADGAASDEFGTSVALSSDSNVALIGAAFKTIGSNSHEGAVYIFGPPRTTTNVNLNGSPDPSSFGQNVTFTATVSPLTATGLVNFSFDTGMTVPATLTGGSAIYSTSALPVGSRIVTATYSGDNNFAPSFVTTTQQVNPFATAITLTSSPNPSLVGQSATFTATLSPTSASGIVSFTFGGSESVTSSVSGGIATYVTNTLPAGTHSVTATYSGDSAYTGATSNTLTQTVSLNPGSVSLTSSPNPSVMGQVVSFTANVIPPGASGTVTFSVDGSVVKTAVLISSTAVYSTSSLSVGPHVITATYNGDTTYAGAVSQPVTQVVQSGCAPLVVTAISDDGAGTSCGTLSYALSQPITGSSGVTITFALSQGSTITFTGSLTTTARVKSGVTIYGGAAGSPNRIIVSGNGVAGDGLHLSGHDYLINLTIEKFGGRELVLEGPGNRLQGVVVNAS